MTARADLHVHSKHSNRPEEWLLRRIAAPESFTEPLDVYRRCRERGMDFVTLSDHDTIDGALEIAHLPGTFLSEEVTVSFPEDGCKIHCLVWGIDEERHREIQRRKENVYELRDYLVQRGIAHAVAHPLYRVNDRLTLDHVEKLLVLFRRFETRNGMHDRHLNELAERVLAGLTGEMLADLAERHGLERHLLDHAEERPWETAATGGSDDHGGLYVATTWTETPAAETVDDFLALLAAGSCAPGGEPGSALRLAQSLFAISHRYFRERFGGGLFARSDPFAELLKSLARPAEPKRRWWRFGPGDDRRTIDQVTLERANRACAQVVERFARRAAVKLRFGRIGEAVGAVSHLAPLAIAAAPYAVAFRTQYKDEALLAAVRRTLTSVPEPAPPAKAWVTDTLAEVNGVTRTIRQVAAAAGRRGLDLPVLTCAPADALTSSEASSGTSPGAPDPPARVHRFEPLSSFPLPGYESLTLSVPPWLELLDHCERAGYDELIVSTPGPMGLAAVAAGRLLGCRVSGVYHTDFPLYVRHLTGDPLLEEGAWATMRWFFGAMDRLFVPSGFYADRLAERGFDGSRFRTMPRGVDLGLFRPERREAGFWRRFGLEAGPGAPPTLLYVGRVSKEKNLELLLRAFDRLRAAGLRVQLAVVGDGPDRSELAALARRRGRSGGGGVAFTGFLHGEELAAAYASADLFVFPSTTDTFGNAVLEALASGLPAVVTDRGGPQEIVRRRGAGRVVAAAGSADEVAGRLADAAAGILADPVLAARLSARALETARASSWEAFVDSLWEAPGEGAETPRSALTPDARGASRRLPERVGEAA